jgi:methylated-DNA-[protein]-cysteine S-methyltransferase
VNVSVFVLNVPTPVGPFGVAGNDETLTAIFLPHERHRASTGSTPRMVARAASQLQEYFTGTRRDFQLQLGGVDATDFQRDVWRALLAIPYGEVRSYGEVAESVGRPRASRAVGNANHVNRYPVIIPCHRVVAASGLGGYGGGDDVKRYLLAIEGVRL